MSDENQKNNLPLNEEEESEEDEEETEKEKKEEEEIKAKEVKNENEINKQTENLDEIKEKNEDKKEENLSNKDDKDGENNQEIKKEENEQQLLKEKEEKEKKEEEKEEEEKEEKEEIKEEKEEKKEEKEEIKEKKEEKEEEINKKNNEKEKEEEINTKNNEKEKEEEEEAKEEEEKTSTYVLRYTRKSKESRESAYDKELIKYKHSLFMIDFKIYDNKKKKFLLIYVHEIAAIYFDEIYEKKYYINDLHKENNHFRIFNDVEDAKNVIDEILNKNKNNSKKIFIELEDNSFKLHIKILFFDKEKEIILNIPKKNIDDKEKIRLLPEFLKEIQIKMNHLEEDNKKLKKESKFMNDSELGNNSSRLSYNEENANNEGNMEIKKSKRSIGKELKKKHERK